MGYRNGPLIDLGVLFQERYEVLEKLSEGSFGWCIAVGS